MFVCYSEQRNRPDGINVHKHVNNNPKLSFNSLLLLFMYPANRKQNYQTLLLLLVQCLNVQFDVSLRFGGDEDIKAQRWSRLCGVRDDLK